MLCIVEREHMRQQTWTRTPTFDRAAWQRHLREAIAAGAGHAGPHDAVHDVEPLSAIGPRSRQWCAIGSSPMAAARGPERIPVLRSHLRPTGAVCHRIGRKPRWPGSVRPRCAGCDPGSVCASACRPVRHRAGAALPSSRQWRSRAPLSSDQWRTMARSPKPAATARRSLTVRRIRNRSGGSISRRTRSDGRDGRPVDAEASRSAPPATSLRPAKLR